MSSLQLPRCLKLPRCSISKEQIGFPWPLFSSRYFSTNADKIYWQFVFYVADFILTVPRKVQETDYSAQAGQFEAASFETRINFTYGHWYRPGMVYGQVLEFFFLQGSLQRTWQEMRLNSELKVRAADLHSWGSNKILDEPCQLIQRWMI